MARQFLAGVATVDMLVGDQLIATANTLLDSSITVGSSAEDVRGGSGAKLLGKYFHTSTFDLTMTDVLFKLEYLAFNTGSPIEQIADMFASEQVTLGAEGKGTLVGTPIEYQDYGVVGWATKAGEYNYQKIEITGKDFTISGGKEGDIYCVKYWNKDSAARKITISSSFIPSEVTLVMKANLFKAGGNNNMNQSSKAGEVQILVPRFLFSGSQEISMTSTGVANSPISGSALDNPSVDCSDGGYYAIITETLIGANWYDNVFALAIDDSDIEINGATTANLSVYAVPTNGTSFKPDYADLTFTSGADGTATVTAEGVITGIANGETDITVAIKDKPTVQAVANVTVSGTGGGR